MKVFINYASADKEMARKLVTALRQEGLDVWYGEDELYPGDNWPAKIGQALEEADAMVVLLTRQALRSEQVHANISFALSNKNYAHRLVTVFADEPAALPEAEVPWILRQLKNIDLFAPASGSESPALSGLLQIAPLLRAPEPWLTAATKLQRERQMRKQVVTHT